MKLMLPPADSPILRSFVDELKSQALPAVWSRGVQLARANKSMTVLSERNDELKFKIKTPERPTAFEVTLWLEEQDAFCSCGSPNEPCVHVAAIAIALSLGLISAEEEPVWRYQWRARDEHLFLWREVKVASGWREVDSWTSYLAGVESGRIQGPVVAVSNLDLRIDAYLQNSNLDHAGLMECLAEVGPIFFESIGWLKAIRPSKMNSFLQARLSWFETTHGRGLRFESQWSQPDRVFKNGYFIVGSDLFWGSQPKNFEVEPQRVPDFISRELPELKERFELELPHDLPELKAIRPELRFEFQRLGDDLMITGRVHYSEGDLAWVKRDLDEEKKLHHELRHRYGMVADQPLKVSPEDILEVRSRFELPQVDQYLFETIASQVGVRPDQVSLDQLKDFSLVELLLSTRDRTEKKLIQQRLRPLLLSSTPEEAEVAPPIQVPRSLWSQLRPYQRAGVRWLVERKSLGTGAILADDMGLGKTIQALSVLEKRTLIIVPTSLLFNWREELKRYRSDLSVCVYHGSGRKWDIYADVIVTTYGTVRSETARFYESWNTLVLDEAHQIRNARSLTSSIVLDLPASFRLALTGTPVQNRVEDLETLLKFISPKKAVSRRSLPVYLLRRTKAEVLLDLPEKTRVEHHLEMSPQERSWYLQAFAAARDEILSRLALQEKNSITLFESLLRARELCDHVGLVDRSKWKESSTKLERLSELLDELLAAGHSVLVYSQWTRFLDRIEDLVRNQEWEYSRLDGSTTHREEVIQEFQQSSNPRVFLLSLHAGGVGLNLTKADHVIFCEPWWNPFVEFQAEDRVHRIGQKQAVTIHRLLCEDTVEMRIHDLQRAKAKLGDYVLSGEGAEVPKPQLTLEDIETLLK